MSTLLLLKLLLVPTLIAGISLAAHRWGPAVAGWLSGFPVVSAPILLFLALERGPEFAAQAAVGTLSAIAAILCFGLSYAWVATRRSWLPTLLIAMTVYAAAVAALNALALPMLPSALLSFAGVILAPRAFPKVTLTPRGSAPPAWNLALRMVVGALLVLLVTRFATNLGSRLSGMLAMFPVMAGVLSVFSHRYAGAAFAVTLLRGMVLGYYAFAVFCLVLAATIVSQGIALGFCVALAGAMAVQLASRRFLAAPPG
jgi:hypothetical protein